MTQYQFTGRHPEHLASDKPVAPGAVVTLTDKEAAEPRNAAMIAEGALVEIQAKRKKRAAAETGGNDA